jgi:hypothetical protein
LARPVDTRDPAPLALPRDRESALASAPGERRGSLQTPRFKSALGGGRAVRCDFESGSVRETGRQSVGGGAWAEVRRREWSRGVGPAGPQGVGNGSPVGRPLARRPGTSGRAPGRHRRPAGTATHHADTLQLRECQGHGRATEGRSRSRGRRRPSDRKARASRPARSEDGSAPVSRGHPGGRRSVIWPNTSPERGTWVTSRFAHRPVVFGPRASAASEAAASP